MSEKYNHWFLENFNLFESLSENTMMQLEKFITDKKAEKKQVIYAADDESNKIYFLKKGKIKISRFSPDGKEHIVAIIGPGEIFGESKLIGSEVMGESAEVIEDAVICSIGFNEFQEFLNKNPELNFKITKLIGFKLQRIQSKLESLCFKSAEERIRQNLKELAEEYGHKNQYTKEITLRLNITHDDLAKLSAATRQKVTTVLGELVRRGIISYKRRKIVIREINKL